MPPDTLVLEVKVCPRCGKHYALPPRMALRCKCQRLTRKRAGA